LGYGFLSLRRRINLTEQVTRWLTSLASLAGSTLPAHLEVPPGGRVTNTARQSWTVCKPTPLTQAGVTPFESTPGALNPLTSVRTAVSETGGGAGVVDPCPAPPLKVAGSGTEGTFPDRSLSPLREVHSALGCQPFRPGGRSALRAKSFLLCIFKGWARGGSVGWDLLLKKSHRFFELRCAPGEPQAARRSRHPAGG
jgi:hypothetical protein